MSTTSPTTSAALAQPDGPTFHAPAGRIVGWQDGDVVRASGIRYARAERFALPVDEPPAKEPIDARAWAPACPQGPDPLEHLIGNANEHLTIDEDCLRVSVTRPAVETAERLPVMVWVHGGGYSFGAGDARSYDPRLLVTEQQVVVVSVTYRLGVLGFLGGAPDRPANLGLYDITAALRWVQRNIDAFGGDPERVTVFGESAGADAIVHLLASDIARGTFGRAIIQSAPFQITRNRSKMNEVLLRAALRYDAGSTIDEIVEGQVEVASHARAFGARGGMPYGVQYGHDPMPTEGAALDAAWRRSAREVDVLIGSNARETALFLDVIPQVRKVGELPLVGRALTELIVRASTWWIYSAGVRRFAALRRRAGGRVRTYRYSWGTRGNPYAAAHAVEVPMLLGDPAFWREAPVLADADWDEAEAAGKTMRGLWADFARDGRLEPVTIDGLIRIR